MTWFERLSRLFREFPAHTDRFDVPAGVPREESSVGNPTPTDRPASDVERAGNPQAPFDAGHPYPHEQPLTPLELVAVRELLLERFPALAARFADERITARLTGFRSK